MSELLTFYSPGGQKMGVYCFGFSPNYLQAGVTASEENVYFGGRLVGKRILSQSGIGNGLVGDFTADRLQSKGNGSNYYPYGESKTGVVVQVIGFGENCRPVRDSDTVVCIAAAPAISGS